MKPNRLHAALALVAVLAVAGCGSSNKSSSTSTSTPAAPATTSSTPTTSGGGAAGGTVKLSADPGGALKFNTTSLTAKAGNVTLDMSNPSSIPHGVAIQGSGVNKVGQVVNQGGSSKVTAKLKAGTYTFYCPVPGHRQAGMQGTLTVK